MEDRLARLESRIEELAGAVENLARRVRALEASPETQPGARENAREERAAEPMFAGTAPRGGVAGIAALLGRTFLVLAGAFLLRALTDAGTLPRTSGVAMGLIYAGVWIFLANRDGHAQKRLSAAFHGVSASIIGFPLLLEATVRFHVLKPLSAAIVLVALTGVALGIAWLRDLRLFAWAVAIGATLTGIGLLVTTHAVELFAATLILLGLATVWLAYSRHWHGIRWPVAAFADIAVLQMIMIAATPGGAPAPYSGVNPTTVAVIAILLFVGYVSLFTIRVLTRGRDVNVFEIGQSGAALLIGFGGAVHLVPVSRFGAVGLGAFGLACGAAAYATAYTAIDRRQGHSVNFFFYTSMALVLVLASTLLVAQSLTLALLLALLGLAAATVGGKYDRVTLRFHSAAYILAAAVAGGLGAITSDAFLAPAAFPRRFSVTAAITLILALGTYLILVLTQRGRTLTTGARIPRFVVAAVATGGCCAALITSASALGLHDALLKPAAGMATVRTIVLAAVCLSAAFLSRRTLFRELGWFVYPLLILGGLKLVIEDLRANQPAALVIAFTAYGLALLFAPRLLRKTRAEE